MLTSLYIENIAVIEKTNIDLYPGLNILTGETGAGKSIVIDAINAIIGQRTSKEIIRTGSDSASVYATFTDINQTVVNKLEKNGYSLDDGELVISRSITVSGKNNCRINGKPCNVSFLRELGLNLINIHGQHESYELFSPDTHINYIDNLADDIGLISQYKSAYSNYKKLKKELKDFESDYEKREQRIDILTYQVNEIDEADIQIGEKESLEEERGILMNFEKTALALHKSKALIEGSDTNGAIDIIDDAAASMKKASMLNPEFENLSTRLTDLYYELQDINNEISNVIDESEANPFRLNEIEERLDLLNKLSRKYGSTEEEIISFLENARTELETLLRYDHNHEELIKTYSKAKAETQALADKLSEMRSITARNFEKKVKAEMVFLNMPDVELIVSQGTVELGDNGQDDIELLISVNPGEEPKPVSKIASGGELSRMMLAIKTVLADSDIIDTLIFDEVDTGISGSASQKVGLKLKEVSKSRQVICVTHQPQIAALADSHYLISKNIQNGRTFTNIKLLDYNERIHELARIIDGVNITETALAHAEKLINYNGE